MSTRLAADKAGSLGWPHARQSLYPRPGAASFLRRLRDRGDGAMRCVLQDARRPPAVAARRAVGLEGDVAPAARSAGVVRPVFGSGPGLTPSPQVRRRAAARGSVGAGNGCPLAGRRVRGRVAGSSPGACVASPSARLRSGRLAGPEHIAGARNTFAGRSGTLAEHCTPIRPWADPALVERSRGVRAEGADGCFGRSGQMDRPGGRHRHHGINPRGLRRSSVRGWGHRGLGSDSGPRALSKVNARTLQSGAGAYTCCMKVRMKTRDAVGLLPATDAQRVFGGRS